MRSSASKFPVSAAVTAVLLAAAAMAGCGGTYHGRGNFSGIDLTRKIQYHFGEISPEELAKTQRWTDLRSKGFFHSPLHSRGGKTLWIKTSLPDAKWRDPVIFFPARSYFQNFDLFLEGDPIFKLSGSACAESMRLPFLPHIVPLPQGFSGKSLYIRFRSIEPGPMGLAAPVYLVSERALIRKIVQRQADRIVLGFIFLFTAVVAFLIFLKNRGPNFYSALAFAILSASQGILVVFGSDLTILFFVNPVIAEKITLLAIIFFPVGLFLFIEKTIGPGYKSIIRRSWQVFLAMSVLAILSFITGIRLPMIAIVLIRSSILLVSIAAALAELVRAIVKGSREARVISIGLIIFGISAVFDGSELVQGPRHEIQLSHWGYFILMLLMGYLLYRAFESGQRKLKRYSEELEEKSEILQELNRTLEEKVQERTEELIEKNRELNSKNQTLEDRNRVIENEISMARKIQQQLIPSRDPSEGICSLYRPMYQVGGDFFDFIDLGPGKTGFFISDVSGHGIPAALITSMVKMTILQAEATHRDPAALLRYLNEALFGQTGDNFITAFYGIIDFVGNSMVYSNAGHNSPFFITPDGPLPIKGPKTVPLATWHNSVLARRGKDFVNAEVDIHPGSKVLFYTDGLVESVNPDDTTRMFEEELPAVLKDCALLDCRGAVDRLYGSLIDFRGGDSFDDDVCIVCVQCR